MRYLEYIYLIGAVFIGAMIATNYKNLSTFAFIGLCIATGLMAFMYSFRRSQRLLMEKMEQEEEDEDEPEAEATDDNQPNQGGQDGI
jgi:K+ transporter